MTLKRPLLSHRVVRIALLLAFACAAAAGADPVAGPKLEGGATECRRGEARISPEMLTTIGDWVVKHSAKK